MPPLSLSPGCVKHLPWCAAMCYLFLAAVLGCWTPTSMFSAETRLPLAASAEFSAAPVQELCSKSVSAMGLLCFS